MISLHLSLPLLLHSRVKWHLYMMCGHRYGGGHLYTFAVNLLSGPSLRFSIVIIWSKVGLLSGPM